jgi:hypothetical protein
MIPLALVAMPGLDHARKAGRDVSLAEADEKLIVVAQDLKQVAAVIYFAL